MLDLVSDVAAMLVPVITSGAGSVAQGAAEHSGARALDVVTRALAKQAGHAAEQTDSAQVKEVLHAALADGTLTEQDLHAFLERTPDTPRSTGAITVTGGLRATKHGIAIGVISTHNLIVDPDADLPKPPNE
jgi:hypothetical protein